MSDEAFKIFITERHGGYNFVVKGKNKITTNVYGKEFSTHREAEIAALRIKKSMIEKEKEIEYKGHSIGKVDDAYYIYQDGIPISEAESVEEAKKMIDGAQRPPGKQ